MADVSETASDAGGAQAGAGTWKLHPTNSTLLREEGNFELNLLETQGPSGKDADEGRELQVILFFRSKCLLCNHFRPPLGFSALPMTVRLIICVNVLISGEQYCCYI